MEVLDSSYHPFYISARMNTTKYPCQLRVIHQRDREEGLGNSPRFTRLQFLPKVLFHDLSVKLIVSDAIHTAGSSPIGFLHHSGPKATPFCTPFMARKAGGGGLEIFDCRFGRDTKKSYMFFWTEVWFCSGYCRMAMGCVEF
jgi:hypothetical protein